MKKYMIAASLVAVGTVGISSVQAGTYAEVSGVDYGTYNPVPPAGVAETSAPTGFGGKFDKYGRVLANANVSARKVTDTGVGLDQLQSGLWSSGDADLFKFKIVNPATFAAFTTGTTQVLALFSADGTALGATRGGGFANALTDAALAASLTPGDYYIGVATGGTPIGVPRNNANEALFDLTTNGVKDPVGALADYKLSTDPYIAWTVASASPDILFSAGSFTAGSSGYINLVGADYSVPEPTSLAALAGIGGLMVLRRRAAR